MAKLYNKFKSRIKKYLSVPKNIYLCIRFPFLYPRNRFSGEHEVYIPRIYKLRDIFHDKATDKFSLVYKFHKDPEEFKDGIFSFKIEDSYTINLLNNKILQIVSTKTSTEFNLQDHVGKDFRILGIESCQSLFGKHVIYYHVSKNEVTSTNYGFQWKMLQIVKNKFYLKLVAIIDWINQYIINPICFIPTYTELDAMPKGWRKCFGIQMCKEIKASLKRSNYLYKYRIMQIKEKYGSLRWYDGAAPEEVHRIIQKYEYISERTCILCGRPATKISNGWLSPYCDDCYNKYFNDEQYEEFKNWYGWSLSKDSSTDK